MDHRRVKGPPDRQTGSGRTDRASLTFRETAASTRTMPRVFLSPFLPHSEPEPNHFPDTDLLGRERERRQSR